MEWNLMWQQTEDCHLFRIYLNVCMYVCLCMYMYVCMFMYVYVCMYYVLCMYVYMYIRYLPICLSVHHHLSAGSLKLFTFLNITLFRVWPSLLKEPFNVAVVVIDASLIYQLPWPRSQCVKALTRDSSQGGAYSHQNTTRASLRLQILTHYERHCSWHLATHRTDYRNEWLHRSISQSIQRLNNWVTSIDHQADNYANFSYLCGLFHEAVSVWLYSIGYWVANCKLYGKKQKWLNL
jgi:hypothetical protein